MRREIYTYTEVETYFSSYMKGECVMKVRKLLNGVTVLSIAMLLSMNVVFADSSESGGGVGFDGDENPPPNPCTRKYVILASGEKYTDVLASTVLANERKCPILLTSRDSIDEKTFDEIRRLDIDEIIISGGEDSVSEKVISQLSGYAVRRVSGANRYDTAIEIGKEVRSLTNVLSGAMLVDGTNFPDVITISGLATHLRVPILLTTPPTLTQSTKEKIAEWSISDITIGGGTNSVSKQIEDSFTTQNVRRFGGINRYETASIIAEEVRNTTTNLSDMVLVDGTNFPDGLTVSTLAANFHAPILLTNPTELSDITKNKINLWAMENVLIGGGTNSVSQYIENNLGVLRTERVAGLNRYETAVKISQRLSNGHILIGR
jgi:cell wall-associated protease